MPQPSWSSDKEEALVSFLLNEVATHSCQSVAGNTHQNLVGTTLYIHIQCIMSSRIVHTNTAGFIQGGGGGGGGGVRTRDSSDGGPSWIWDL